MSHLNQIRYANGAFGPSLSPEPAGALRLPNRGGELLDGGDRFSRAAEVSTSTDDAVLDAASRDADPVVRLAAVCTGRAGTGARAAKDRDPVIRALATTDRTLPADIDEQLRSDPRVGRVLELICA